MKARILLADDHAVMREGLAVVLEKAGFEIVGKATNGRDAVELARQTSPDVIVMDISMPGMNGIDATRDICTRWPKVNVVVLSMHFSQEHLHQALGAGAKAYVLKDAAAAEVVSAVRAAQAGRRYISPALGTLLPDTSARSPVDSLSIRERQVLQLVVEGKSSTEIAHLVHLSPKSVETYRARLMRKLGVKDVPGLVKFAVLHGLTPPG